MVRPACYAILLLKERQFLTIQARIDKKYRDHYDDILLAGAEGGSESET